MNDELDELDEILVERGVSRQSDFYDYIKRRMVYAEILQDLIDSVGRRGGFRIAEELAELNELKNKNLEIMRTRYQHYNMLRNSGGKGTVEKRLDKYGDTYMNSAICRVSDTMGWRMLDEIKRTTLGGSVIEAEEKIRNVYSDLEIILAKDKELMEITRQYDRVNEDMRRHYKPKEIGKIQMLKEAVENVKKMKPEKKLALVLGVGVAIAGINYCSTLNRIDNDYSSKSYSQVVKQEQRIDNSYQQTNYQAGVTITNLSDIDSITKVSPTITTKKENVEPEPAPTVKFMETAADVTTRPFVYTDTNPVTQTRETNATATSTPKPKVMQSELEACVDSMSPEFVSVLADAIREGDKNLPIPIRDGEGIYYAKPGLSDEEIVKSNFKALDPVLRGRAKAAYPAAYQLPYVMGAAIKYDMMMREGIPMENIDFYFHYSSRGAATSYTIQEVEIRNGYKVEVDKIKNGKASYKDSLSKLCIAKGTLDKVLNVIGFSEIDDNSVFDEAIAATNNNLIKVICEAMRAEKARENNNYDMDR